MKTLTEEQQDAVVRIYETDATILIGQMGAGKTVVALTAATELLDDGVLDRILIVGPARVVKEVWPNEACEWAHLDGRRVVSMVGDPNSRYAVWSDPRNRIIALSIENLPWFLDNNMLGSGQRWGLIIDELTRFKTPGSKCVRKLRRQLDKFDWRVGMTGTPVSDSWLSLYSMCLVVDGGKTFGTRYDQWKLEYFYPIDYEQHQWALKPDSDTRLTEKISGLVHTIPDYRSGLPALTVTPIPVRLDATARSTYDTMASECMADDIEAVNEAVLVGKLQQLASGFLYTQDADEPVRRYHMLKIDTLMELLDDRPTVIVYWYQADLEILKEVIGGARVGTEKGVIEDWNGGKVNRLLLHPRSAGHGLNLQDGGSRMIWLGPQWSRDLHDQTIARLWRQGQKSDVECLILYAHETIDEAVLARLKSKSEYDRVLHRQLSKLSSS